MEIGHSYYALRASTDDNKCAHEFHHWPAWDQTGTTPWIDGQLRGDLGSAPLEYELETGHLLPYYAEEQPLMSLELLTTLHDFGIDNLETYAANIRQDGRQAPIQDYRAVNVIGIVSALDNEDSSWDSLGIHSGVSAPRFFHRLRIDPPKAHGLLMFRLVQRRSLIIVHRSVKQHIEANVSGMDFDLL